MAKAIISLASISTIVATHSSDKLAPITAPTSPGSTSGSSSSSSGSGPGSPKVSRPNSPLIDGPDGRKQFALRNNGGNNVHGRNLLAPLDMSKTGKKNMSVPSVDQMSQLILEMEKQKSSQKGKSFLPQGNPLRNPLTNPRRLLNPGLNPGKLTTFEKDIENWKKTGNYKGMKVPKVPKGLSTEVLQTLSIQTLQSLKQDLEKTIGISNVKNKNENNKSTNKTGWMWEFTKWGPEEKEAEKSATAKLSQISSLILKKTIAKDKKKQHGRLSDEFEENDMATWANPEKVPESMNTKYLVSLSFESLKTLQRQMEHTMWDWNYEAKTYPETLENAQRNMNKKKDEVDTLVFLRSVEEDEKQEKKAKSIIGRVLQARKKSGHKSAGIRAEIEKASEEPENVKRAEAAKAAAEAKRDEERLAAGQAAVHYLNQVGMGGIGLM